MRPGKYIRNSIETLYFVLFLCDKLGQIFLHVYNGTVIQFFVTSQTFSMAQIFMYSYWSLHVVTFTYLYVFIYVMVEICVVLVAVKCFIFLCQASVLLWQHVFFFMVALLKFVQVVYCTLHIHVLCMGIHV